MFRLIGPPELYNPELIYSDMSGQLWRYGKAFWKRLLLIAFIAFATGVTIAWMALLAFGAIQFIGWAL